MLPGGPLAKKQLTKLKMYSGSEHPHSAQNFTVIELSKLNNKNLVKKLKWKQIKIYQKKKEKIKLDFKDSKYATGRRKTSIAKSLA